MDGAAEQDGGELVFRALADATRRGILDLLREGPRTTGDLAEAFPGLSRFGVMKHLGVLEEAGLVLTRKEGRQKWNHLNAVPLRAVYERWVGRFADRWASASLRLKEAAEARERAKETDMATTITETARVAVVETEIEIAARVPTVFDAWFEDTAEWFFESEDSKSVRPAVCERRVGGRFYMDLSQQFAPGDQNTLATVTMIKTNREIRLRGDCTIPSAFVANMTIRFEETGGGTRVKVSHRMCGEFDDDLPKGFEEGWYDGLEKLKALVESR